MAPASNVDLPLAARDCHHGRSRPNSTLPDGPDPTMSESTKLLRVMTWNLWWRFGSWQTRLVAIRSVLHTQRPDIIGLQEVWDDRKVNLAAQLSEELGYFFSWSPALNTDRWRGRPIDSGVKVGNAILSRWPITSEDQLRLPEGNVDEGRTALFASVDVRGVQVPFFTTQLTSAPDQSSLRCEQVSALASFVVEHRTNRFPVIVAGDLNAEPDSDEVRMLCGHKTSGAVPGLVLVDAWRYTESTDPGWTWDRKNPHVDATGEPSARIDYVLVGPPTDGRSGRVTAVHVAGDEAVDGVWPSDHAAVVVELELPRPAGGMAPRT
jgi:endonuclease/exonuclease/phosphatase family metal-dependent hydrolase